MDMMAHGSHEKENLKFFGHAGNVISFLTAILPFAVRLSDDFYSGIVPRLIISILSKHNTGLRRLPNQSGINAFRSYLGLGELRRIYSQRCRNRTISSAIVIVRGPYCLNSLCAILIRR
jgi:hypothetical protein